MGDDEKVEPVVKGNVVEQIVSDEDFHVSDQGSFNADNYMDNMGSSGTLEFKTPELDSEEGGEQNMPLRLGCPQGIFFGHNLREVAGRCLVFLHVDTLI